MGRLEKQKLIQAMYQGFKKYDLDTSQLSLSKLEKLDYNALTVFYTKSFEITLTENQRNTKKLCDDYLRDLDITIMYEYILKGYKTIIRFKDFDFFLAVTTKDLEELKHFYMHLQYDRLLIARDDTISNDHKYETLKATPWRD